MQWWCDIVFKEDRFPENNYSKLKPLKIGSQDYVVSTD